MINELNIQLLAIAVESSRVHTTCNSFNFFYFDCDCDAMRQLTNSINFLYDKC